MKRDPITNKKIVKRNLGTISVYPETRELLDEQLKLEQRGSTKKVSKSEIVEKAIREYCDRWRSKKIKIE